MPFVQKVKKDIRKKEESKISACRSLPRAGERPFDSLEYLKDFRVPHTTIRIVFATTSAGDSPVRTTGGEKNAYI